MRLVFATLLIVISASCVEAASQDHVYPYFEFERGKQGPIVRWGLLDRTGRALFPAKFDEIEGAGSVVGGGDAMGLSGPLIPVKTGGKWGYSDRAGTLILPAKYDQAGRFSEGLAPVELGEACGYIDSTGREVVPLRFTACSDFSEGLAAVCTEKEEKTGFIDRTGRWVIKQQFLMADGFHEGKAMVVVGSDNDFMEILGWQGGHYRFIDRTGRFAFKGKFDKALSFSEGLACVRVDGTFGFIDHAGKMMIQPQFVRAEGFSSGLASVSTSKEFETADEYGYIDRSGAMVIAPRKWDAMSFRGDLAVVRPVERGKKPQGEGMYELTEKGLGPPIYIDRTGRTALQVEGARVLQAFIGDLAWVHLEDGRWGYIDRSGAFVWGPKPNPF